MSSLYRWPSKDASYQVSIHLSSGFRGEDFLEINQSETRIDIDASYQVSVHLAKQFQSWTFF